jgi:hypothetical protein
MSDLGVPSAAANEAPASAPSDGQGPANDNSNAGNPASEAAKTLNARRAEIRAALAAPKSQQASSDTKEPASATGAKSPEQSSPATSAPDSDELAALIREDRRIKSEAKRLEMSKAEFKEYESDVQRARAAREALKTGNRIGALKALFPDEDLTSDLFWDLAKAVGEEPEGERQPDIKELVAAQVAAKLAADKEAAEENERNRRSAAEAGLNEARSEYVSACGQAFAANKDKFPAIAALGIHAERIREFVEDEFRPRNGGKIPSTFETLAALEQELVARVRMTPYAAREEAPVQRAATVSSSWRSDPGRPANDNSANETLEQSRERRRALLRQGAR